MVLNPVILMETLTRKEMAEARLRARRVRIRTIRRRIAYGATVLVALFSGAILLRSLEQTTRTATSTSAATLVRGDDSEGSDEESSLAGQVSSAFEDDGEDGSSTPSSTAAPLTTSQS
jgi:hypothetical protein